MKFKSSTFRILLINFSLFISLTAHSQYSPSFRGSEILSCPDENHPHAIDLGLPSGTKWACCNIDATKPSEYGGYYAWGETKEKEKYENYNYEHFNHHSLDGSLYKSSLTYDSISIVKSKHDVAFVKWGGRWHMPNYSQVMELENNCNVRGANVDSVYGCLLIGPNHNKIFLPAAGTKCKYPGKPGKTFMYWSGHNGGVYGKIGPLSLILDINGKFNSMYDYYHIGASVRAVYE